MSATDIFWHLTSSDHDMLWFSPQTSFSTSEVISMWDGEQGGLPEIGLCDRIYAPRTKKHGFWRDQNMVIRWSRFFHGFRRDTVAVINVWLRFLCFFVQMRLEMEVLCRSYVWLWVFWFRDFQGKHMACHDATDLSPSASDSSVEIHHRFSSERSAPTVADPVMSADHSTWIKKKTVGDRRLHVFIQWWYIYMDNLSI